MNTCDLNERSAVLKGVDFAGVRIGAMSNQIDVHAQAYIDAENITDATAIAAINTLVKDLKAINVVDAGFVDFDTPVNSKRKAIYPFPGTVAATNTRNLINPADSDAAFRCTVTGTPTKSTLGVKFVAGSNFDTKINSSTVLNINNHEFGFALSDDSQNDGVVFEISSGATLRASMQYPTTYTSWINSGDYQLLVAHGETVGNGIKQTNRQSSSIGGIKVIRNNVIWGTNAALQAGTLPNANIKLGNGAKTVMCFAGIGEAISDIANNLYNIAIERYNYNMGRLRLHNILIEGHSFTSGDLLINRPMKLGLLANNIVIPYANRTIGSGGATMTTLNGRTSTVVKWYKDKTNLPFVNTMVIWIGTNDNFTTEAYTALKAYIQARITEGWSKFFVFTGTPTTIVGRETNRIVFNNSLRTDLSLISGVHIIDTDLIEETTDPSNTTYYSDGLHPTQTLNNIVVSEGLVPLMISVLT